MEIYFTADLHLGHGRIIKHCKRPFENSHYMDEALIKNWNSVVKNGLGLYSRRFCVERTEFVSKQAEWFKDSC